MAVSKALPAALVFALCGCAGTQAPPPPAKLWSTYDLVAGAQAGKSFAGIPALTFVTPRGQPLPWLSPPYSAAPAAQRADFDGLDVFPAFSEGEPANYATTDVWQGIPAVWVQPLYLPVTGFTARDAVPLP